MELFRHCPCPVWAVGPGVPREQPRIAAAVDVAAEDLPGPVDQRNEHTRRQANADEASARSRRTVRNRGFAQPMSLVARDHRVERVAVARRRLRGQPEACRGSRNGGPLRDDRQQDDEKDDVEDGVRVVDPGDDGEGGEDDGRRATEADPRHERDLPC